jgi:hypothetical protein
LKAERRKWRNYYSNSPDAIIYVGSLSQYNQLDWDGNNKMISSLEEFKNISQNTDIPLFLILNKKDMFCHELSKESISVAFPDCPDTFKELIKPIFDNPIKINETETNVKANISNLSEDELNYIFSFLGVFDLLHISMVNSNFHCDHFWKLICQRFDPKIDEKKVMQYFDPFQCVKNPWKYYLFKTKFMYDSHVNFIIEKYKEVVPWVKQVYVTSAFSGSMDQVIDEIFNAIIKLK